VVFGIVSQIASHLYQRERNSKIIKMQMMIVGRMKTS